MEKYKVIISPDPLPEQEIEAHKDFEQLLKNHQAAVHTKYWWQAGVSALSVAGLVGVWLYLTPGPEVNPDHAAQVDRQDVRQEQVTVAAPAQPAPVAPAVPQMAPAPAPAPALAKSPAAQPQAKEREIALETTPATQPELAVFTQPEPTVGFKGLQEFFGKHMQRPAGTEGLQGTVLVSFVINEQGQPEDLEVEKSLQEALDAEALRLVRLMPAWKPATANGKPVPTRIAVPVQF